MMCLRLAGDRRGLRRFGRRAFDTEADEDLISGAFMARKARRLRVTSADGRF